MSEKNMVMWKERRYRSCPLGIHNQGLWHNVDFFFLSYLHFIHMVQKYDLNTQIGLNK